MTVFYAKLLKLSVVVATSAINTNVFDHKVVCCDPIEPLLSVRDSVVKFDVNIAIKRSVFHVEVDALWVHVHIANSRA